MFGQDDNNAQNDDITAVNPTLTSTDASTPADDATTDDSSTPSVSDTPAIEPTPTPPVEEPETPEEPAAPEVADNVPSVSDSPPSSDDAGLLSLKKQTLEELSPLLDKLDQTPEEKFKTTMMMIQATDSAHLIKNAHEAALKITDEKARAQALLDIVNEINYFTQQDK